MPPARKEFRQDFMQVMSLFSQFGMRFMIRKQKHPAKPEQKLGRVFCNTLLSAYKSLRMGAGHQAILHFFKSNDVPAERSYLNGCLFTVNDSSSPPFRTNGIRGHFRIDSFYIVMVHHNMVGNAEIVKTVELNIQLKTFIHMPVHAK